MSLLDLFIKRKVKDTCERVIAEELPGIMNRVVQDVLRETWKTDPLFRFIKWGQWELERADPTLDGKTSFEMAKDALRQHLKDEKIEFGDPRFAWDDEGARAVIHEYHIDHWEQGE